MNDGAAAAVGSVDDGAAGEADIDAAALPPVNRDASSASTSSIVEDLLAADHAHTSLPPGDPVRM